MNVNSFVPFKTHATPIVGCVPIDFYAVDDIDAGRTVKTLSMNAAGCPSANLLKPSYPGGFVISRLADFPLTATLKQF